MGSKSNSSRKQRSQRGHHRTISSTSAKQGSEYEVLSNQLDDVNSVQSHRLSDPDNSHVYHAQHPQSPQQQSTHGSYHHSIDNDDYTHQSSSYMYTSSSNDQAEGDNGHHQVTWAGENEPVEGYALSQYISNQPAARGPWPAGSPLLDHTLASTMSLDEITMTREARTLQELQDILNHLYPSQGSPTP